MAPSSGKPPSSILWACKGYCIGILYTCFTSLCFPECCVASAVRRKIPDNALYNAPTMNKSAEIHMGWKDGFHTIETCLFLPRPLEETFPFFADAGNLEVLTPPWLRFEILSPMPMVMRAGAIIEYRLRLHGIHLRWQSEITTWAPPLRFVDEQRRGPYRKWIHEHTFTRCGNGCEMRDFVRYSVPGGRLANLLFVQRDVRRIFEYRSCKLSDFFS
jgi:ligand-binding SRPBCC domain-containing protein